MEGTGLVGFYIAWDHVKIQQGYNLPCYWVNSDGLRTFHTLIKQHPVDLLFSMLLTEHRDPAIHLENHSLSAFSYNTIAFIHSNPISTYFYV